MANATLIGTTGGQVNPLLMTSALVQNAMQGLNTLGDGRLDLARLENERAYRNRLLDDARRYERETYSQRRADQKADQIDAAERAINSRLREDKLLFEQHQAQWQTKSENEIRQAARLRGIQNSDTAPLESLRTSVANYDAEQSISLKAKMMEQSIAAARQMPGYAKLKAARDQKLLERDKLLAQTVLPEPVFNPEMTPQERAAMYQMMADSPQIQMELAKIKDGPKRLAALRNGDVAGAVGGLDAATAESISMLWSGQADAIEKSLQAGKYSKYSAALQQYVAKLRALPQMLSAVDRDLDQLYTIGDKDGLNIGMALRMEDPNDYAPKTDEMPPTAVSGDEGGPQQQPAMPWPTAAATPEESGNAQSQEPAGRYVEGILPWAWRNASGGVGALRDTVINDPMLMSGAANLSSGIERGASSVGNLYQSLRRGVFGGYVPPELDNRLMDSGSPTDVLVGAGQMFMSPFSMIGNAMSDTATALTGTVPGPNGRINPYAK